MDKICICGSSLPPRRVRYCSDGCAKDGKNKNRRDKRIKDEMDRKRVSEKNRKYYEKNRDRLAAEAIKKNKKRALRIPGWLTDENWAEMLEIYVEAGRMTRETGIEHQVDHIVPLVGKIVSGLHVPENLRVITKDDNLSKSNKWENED